VLASQPVSVDRRPAKKNARSGLVVIACSDGRQAPRVLMPAKSLSLQLLPLSLSPDLSREMTSTSSRIQNKSGTDKTLPRLEDAHQIYRIRKYQHAGLEFHHCPSQSETHAGIPVMMMYYGSARVKGSAPPRTASLKMPDIRQACIMLASRTSTCKRLETGTVPDSEAAF